MTFLVAVYFEATCDGGAVTKDSAYRLQRTCAESAAGVLGLVFCLIAVWRRTAQERRGAERRPADCESASNLTETGGGGSRDRTGLSQGNSRHRRKNREIQQIYAGKGT